MNDKNESEDIIKQAEKSRIEAETAKFASEKKKIDLEISQAQNNIRKPWYKKERIIQAFVAGIVSFPILWFFFNEVIKPSYQRDNILLSLENKKQELKLYTQQENMKSLKAEFKSLSAKAEEDRNLAWDELEATKKKYVELVAKNETLLARYKVSISDSFTAEKSKKINEIEQSIAALKSITEQTQVAYKPTTALVIQDYRLLGESVEFHESPNTSGEFSTGYPDSIVFHYSGSNNLESTVKHYTKQTAKASAHVLIGRDGKIVQLLPFNKQAWHAGRSSYKGRQGYNKYAIAIELINAGVLTKDEGRYRSWFGKTYDESDVKQAVGRNETSPLYWQKFTSIQIKRAKEIATLLTKNFEIKEILGNDEIAPDRKSDPGPLFPTEDIREKLLTKI